VFGEEGTRDAGALLEGSFPSRGGGKKRGKEKLPKRLKIGGGLSGRDYESTKGTPLGRKGPG